MIGWCLRCSVYPRRWPALTSTPGGTTAGCCWPSPREGPPRTSGKALLRQAWARRENSLKDRASISIGGSFKPSSRQICVWISSAIASTFTKITFPWECKSKSIWQWWDGRYKVTDFSLIKKTHHLLCHMKTVWFCSIGHQSSEVCAVCFGLSKLALTVEDLM